jgi:N-acetylmuramoyl-L-alanine amidase
VKVIAIIEKSTIFIPLQKNNTKVKTPITIILTVFLMLLSSFQPVRIGESKVKVIVIDAGHGGKDPGAVAGGVKEKDIVLAVSRKLGALIKEAYPEVKVYYTRLGDSFLELSERSNIANRNKADLFISVHCNANANQKAQGSETYVMGTHKNESNLEVAKRENSAVLLEDNYQEDYEGFDPGSPEGHIIFSFYQNAYLEQSILVASKVEEHFAKRKKAAPSRGVKQAGFLVLWKAAMPSVLVELGFITNPEERKYLNSESGQQESAEAIFKAIREYKEEVEK